MSHQSDLIEHDIHGYLAMHEHKDLLRFITCGSVDDGKSTLIGRLLHDSKLIFEDQLAAIERDSRKFNTTDQAIDLALLVDGLQAEREQGITIDVAYRYFSTDKRKFIIADCPGHEQYTRNMATGASTSDLAIILIDARSGVKPQTRRHSYIVSLLGIRHVVVAVNKMDLVGYDEATYQRICADYQQIAADLGISEVRYIPMSALRGDLVVKRGDAMPWYNGPTLKEWLEDVRLDEDVTLTSFRLPVQYVNRPNAGFRGFSGTVAAGEIRPGDEVISLPSGRGSRVREIVTADGNLPVARRGQAITLTLEDEIDVSRGDMLVRAGEVLPEQGTVFSARLVWMNDDPLTVGRPVLFRFAGKVVPGKVRRLVERVDVNDFSTHPATQLGLNEIASVEVELAAPVVFDAYTTSRATGSFIVIDRLNNATLGAGMIRHACELAPAGAIDDELANYRAFERELNALVRKHFPHWEAKAISEVFGKLAGDD